MPHYHCLDTQVQLRTWAPILPTSDGLQDLSSNKEESLSDDPAGTCTTTTMDEHFFRGHEGLDFLGADMPFYLVHAGQDQFRSACSLRPLMHIPKPKSPDQDLFGGMMDTTFKSNLSNLKSSQFATAQAESTTNSELEKEYSLPDYSQNKFPMQMPGSPLPVLSSGSSSLHGDNLASRDRDFEFMHKLSPLKQIPKNSKYNGDTQDVRLTSSTFGVTPRPLSIVIKLSEKSFLHPIFGGSDMRQDICLNIFFNGEFNVSEIISYSTWSSKRYSKLLYYGGRRIEISREIPWVISNSAGCSDGVLRLPKDESVDFSPLQRWQKLADLLVNEAEEWGKDESGHRNPTGDYLEMLSRKPMPSDLGISSDFGGGRFGVIDIVLTLGCSSHSDISKFLSSPCRKLPDKETPKDLANSVQNNLSPSQNPLQSITDFSFGSSNPKIPENSKLSHVEMILHSASICSTIDSSFAATGIVSSSRTDSAKSMDTNLSSLTSAHDDASNSIAQWHTSMTSNSSTTPISKPKSRSPHPGRPKFVPQKRYQGSYPQPHSEPRPKRRRIVDSIGQSIELNNATSMCTRTTRSSNSPFAQLPSTTQQIDSTKSGNMKSKRIIIKKEGTKAQVPPSKSPNSQAQIFVVPVTPEKVMVKAGPGTPRLRGSLKKKPRSAIYNRKYSNRPQNLRRKNPAGEWETPVKAKRQSKIANPSLDRVKETTHLDTSINSSVFTAAYIKNQGQEKVRGQPLQASELSVEAITTSLKSVRQPKSVKTKSHRSSTGPEVTEHLPQRVTKNQLCPDRVSIILRAPTISCANQGINAENEGTLHIGEDATLFATQKEPPKKPFHIKFFRQSKDAIQELHHIVKARNTDGSNILESFASPDSGKKVVREFPVRNLFNLCTPHIDSTSKIPFTVMPSTYAGDSTDLVTSSEFVSPGHPQAKFSSIDHMKLDSTHNRVIATLRYSSPEKLKQVHDPEGNNMAARFLVPGHDSTVPKFFKEPRILREKPSNRQEVQVVPHLDITELPMNTKVHKNLPSYVQNGAQSSGGKGSSASQTDSNIGASSSTLNISMADPKAAENLAVSLRDLQETSQPLRPTVNSGRNSALNDRPTNEPVGKLRPRQSRMVGVTELKALLECYPRDRVVSVSSGSTYDPADKEFMTRPSRSAVPNRAEELAPVKNVSVRSQVASTDSIGTISTTTTDARNSPVLNIEAGNKAPTGAEVTAFLHRGDMERGVEALEGASRTQGTVASGRGSRRIFLRTRKDAKLPESGVTAVVKQLNKIDTSSGGADISATDGISRKIKKPVSRLKRAPQLTSQPEKKTFKVTIKDSSDLNTIVDGITAGVIKEPELQNQETGSAVQQAKSCSSMKLDKATEKLFLALNDIDKAQSDIGNAGVELKGLPMLNQIDELFTTNLTQIQDLHTDDVGQGNEHDLKMSVQRGEEKTSMKPHVICGPTTWKPSPLCDSSVLNYASNESCVSFEKDLSTGQVYRSVRAEKGGYFKASGVLMGVSNAEDADGDCMFEGSNNQEEKVK